MPRISRHLAILLNVGVALAIHGTAANAQEYPQRQVQVIVPFGASSGLDVVTRFVVDRLTREWNSPMVVENRPGGGGVMGTEVVARAKPDGHTLLATTQTLYTNASLYKTLPYDAAKFIPVVRITAVPLVIVSAPTASFDNIKGLVAEAKANPQKLSYASLGSGSTAHMAGALLNSLAGTQMLHVPYKESSQAITDTMRGEVSLNFVAIPTAAAQLRAGRLKALAVTGTKRSAALPDVPTVAESGIPGYEFVAWHGLLAPAGTPPAVIEKISSSVLKIARAPEFQAILQSQGLELALDSASDFSAKLPAELVHWAKVVAATGVKLD